MSNLPNYWPNSFLNVKANLKFKEHVEKNVSGDVDRHDSSNDDNFEQVTDFWTKVLTPEERERLCNNIGSHLVHAQPFIQERAIANFEKVHPDYGAKVRLAIKKVKVFLI
jgi:catalase